MSTGTVLLKVRFPRDLVECLDRLGERLRLQDRPKIPRAALVRALVRIYLSTPDEDRPNLAELIEADPVRRGRVRRETPCVEEHTPG